VLSTIAFVGVSLLLVPGMANLGLWLALVFYVIARAVALGVRFPALRASLQPSGSPETSP
jgi:MATE family multidrug resistance protein